MLTELTLTSYPGNFIENGTEGPIKIMVDNNVIVKLRI